VASSIIPGWHTTIYPWYYSLIGILFLLALSLMLAIVLRKFAGLEDKITINRLDLLAKVMVVFGVYGFIYYSLTGLMLLYSGFLDIVAQTGVKGMYAHTLLNWLLRLVIAFSTQLFWFKKFRRTESLSFAICLFILSLIGVWIGLPFLIF